MTLQKRLVGISVFALMLSLLLLFTLAVGGAIHLPRTDSDRMSDRFTLCAEAGVSMSQCPLN